MKTIIVMVCLFVASPVFAQSTVHERADQALLIGGLSMSSVALGLTMSCTSAGTCRELNPAMAKRLGESPVNAAVFKSASNGVAYYTLWRVTHNRPKTRTILLVALTALNTFDAVHDVRQLRKGTR